ncbi:hypothetical protein ECFRIK1999_5658, partial [Escherichia coli FRIK1999]
RHRRAGFTLAMR